MQPRGSIGCPSVISALLVLDGTSSCECRALAPFERHPSVVDHKEMHCDVVFNHHAPLAESHGMFERLHETQHRHRRLCLQVSGSNLCLEVFGSLHSCNHAQPEATQSLCPGYICLLHSSFNMIVTHNPAVCGPSKVWFLRTPASVLPHFMCGPCPGLLSQRRSLRPHQMALLPCCLCVVPQ